MAYRFTLEELATMQEVSSDLNAVVAKLDELGPKIEGLIPDMFSSSLGASATSIQQVVKLIDVIVMQQSKKK